MSVANVVLDHASMWVQICGAPFDMVSPQVAIDIGGWIGIVEEVEKRRSNDSQRLFMRVRVSISISKPLRRGCFVSDSEGNCTWFKFKYEKLVMFCYLYGFVGHDLKLYVGLFAMEKSGATMELQYGDWLKAVGGRQRSTSRVEGEIMIDSQNRAVQREAVGRSELVAQKNSGFRGTLPVFSKNIPIRGDTGSLDKERDQRVSHVAWAEVDFEEVLEKIDAAIEGQEYYP